MTSKNWFVVQTKPRKEKLAINNLERQGFTVYCPQTVLTKRRRQVWQKIIEPLFPRYLFVRLQVGVDSFSPIRSTQGVVGLVQFGSQPAVMPLSAIEAIQRQENSIQDNALAYPEWEKGEELKILEGPFAGLRGVFQKKLSMERVSLLLDILGQQNPLTVNINRLVPVL